MREQEPGRGGGGEERAREEWGRERRRLEEKIKNIEEQLAAASEACRVRGCEYEAEHARAARDAEMFSHELADAAAREQHLYTRFKVSRFGFRFKVLSFGLTVEGLTC